MGWPTDSPNSERAFGQRTGPWGFLVTWQGRGGNNSGILVAFADESEDAEAGCMV